MPVQAGFAGVRYTNPGWGGVRVMNWASHFDLAYNITIRDTIPWGVTYIPGSASGQFNTGSRQGQPLTATVANNVITWPVVSGNTPQQALGANDSLTLTWRAVVDTARNRLIINTAYADLDGFPADSIGAQVRSRFFMESDIDTNDIIDTNDVPKTGLHVTANPRSCIFTGSITVTLSAFIDSVAAAGAQILYTRNGSMPDPFFIGMGTEVYAEPLEIRTHTTLRAMAVLDEFEESPIITYIYEPLRTVPILSATYFGDAGDGLAQGIHLALTMNRLLEPDTALIWKYMNLIEITDNPRIDRIRLIGDTLTLFFRGPGVEVPEGARINIRVPQFPDSASVYTVAHGYLADDARNIGSRVVPRPPPPPPVLYSLRVGPNPFRTGNSDDAFNIFIYQEPFDDSVNAIIRIFDRLGNIVALSGENLISAGVDHTLAAPRHKFTWNGANRRGRVVGNGTYLVQVVITAKSGERRTFTQLVYVRSR